MNDSGRGARFALRDIPSAEPGLSPLEIWCNEAQERYVLAISADRLPDFAALCARERCPHAVIGRATDDGRLVVEDALAASQRPPMPRPSTCRSAVLLGKPPRSTRQATRLAPKPAPFVTTGIDLGDAVRRVLRLPTVADKTFLITIGDRTVGGLTARDQMVGRWQVPVADAAVTATGFDVTTGEAMAMGERAPVALLDAAASARLAVAEAITNIASAPIARLGDVKLSANWMAAAGTRARTRASTTRSAPSGASSARRWGSPSRSARTRCRCAPAGRRDGSALSVTAPLSLVVTAFAPVTDVRRVLTPAIAPEAGPTELLLIDLGQGKNRLGGSALAQVYGALGAAPPDLEDPALLAGFFAAVQELNAAGLLAAYHDRSDGGLLVTLLEIAFASGVGLDVDLTFLGPDPIATLFAEELGAVIAVRGADLPRVVQTLGRHGISAPPSAGSAPRAPTIV